MSSLALKANELSITFGGLKAVENFNIEVGSNQLVGLIGPNGAGKTTVFNLLTGVYQPTAGNIEVDGISIVGKSAHQITGMGVARTFQNIRLFKKMTVLDNVKVAYNKNMKYGFLEGILHAGRYAAEEAELDKKARDLLKIFDMEQMADTPAESLPYGKQRKLEIARALATDPKLLLLDEPAAGMNPTETRELMDTIALIRKKFGVAILLIEHDMGLVMGICEKIYVLNYGKVLAAGRPEQIANDEKVITAYLGA